MDLGQILYLKCYDYQTRPKWKATKMEDDKKWKTNKIEDEQNGRRLKWKTTKMEVKKNGRQYQKI